MLEAEATVMLVAHSQYRAVYSGVARRLVADLRASVHLYTSTVQESQFYQTHEPELYDSVTEANILYSVCQDSVEDATAVVDRARSKERKYGLTINELSVSDRHLGRGYALGGFKHPRSRQSEGTSYLQMLNAYNAEIEFWERELERTQPDLVLNGSKVLSVIARHHGIQTRTLTGARYKTQYYWAVNEFLELGRDLFSDAPSEPDTDLDFDQPYSSYTVFRQRFGGNTRFLNTLKTSVNALAREMYWRVRRYEKARSYFVWENIFYAWRKWRDARRMSHSSLPRLDDLRGQPFVFFPLATEPESALQLLSPECLSQLACIEAVCRNVPAGVKVVVKEHHTALGRRPTDFYRQIAEFKNALIMNMDEPGFFVVKACTAVATITGTAGFEGAIMGKPTLAFGRRNIYRNVPHVYTVQDPADLKANLHALLEYDTKTAERDGARFLSAVIDASFDLGNYTQWDRGQIEQTSVDNAFDGLIKSLGVNALTDTDRRVAL